MWCEATLCLRGRRACRFFLWPCIKHWGKSLVCLNTLYIFLYAALMCLVIYCLHVLLHPLTSPLLKREQLFNRCHVSSTAHSMSTAPSSSPAAWSGAQCTSRRSFGARTPFASTRRITSSSSKTKSFLLPVTVGKMLKSYSEIHLNACPWLFFNELWMCNIEWNDFKVGLVCELIICY